MRRRMILILTGLFLVLTMISNRGFSQQQIVLSGTGTDVKYTVLDFQSFSPLPNGPRGVVDLEALRAQCETIQVKLAANLAEAGGIPILRLAYRTDAGEHVPIVEISRQQSTIAKVQSDWVDLIATAPPAGTEALGYFDVQLRIQGSRAFAGGSTIILKCVPPAE